MPWTMNDYPQTWKHLDELERKRNIANAMLKDGYKEGDYSYCNKTSRKVVQRCQ